MDGNQDVPILQQHLSSKLTNLFLSPSPVAVVEWITRVVNDQSMPDSVKALLLRSDRMALVYRYLLEQGKLGLVKKVVVENELIELDKLIWSVPPFDLPVVALGAHYPADMEGLFVKELNIPDRIKVIVFVFLHLVLPRKTKGQSCSQALA